MPNCPKLTTHFLLSVVLKTAEKPALSTSLNRSCFFGLRSGLRPSTTGLRSSRQQGRRPSSASPRSFGQIVCTYDMLFVLHSSEQVPPRFRTNNMSYAGEQCSVDFASLNLPHTVLQFCLFVCSSGGGDSIPSPGPPSPRLLESREVHSSPPSPSSSPLLA